MGKRMAAAGSALFFVLAPGVVAGVMPWLMTGWESRDPVPVVAVLGLVILVAGAGVLVHAFARFVVEGIGTPAPVAPTEELVVGGLYRYVRNPMYIAVVSAVVGQALLLAQTELLLYAAGLCVLFGLFVHFYEEPTLRRQFGPRYDDYRRAVPGWVPRRPR